MTTDLRLRYQTLEFGKTDIHLCTLRDRQEFSDPEGIAEDLGISSAAWPMFGVIWPSSQVLAHYIVDMETAGLRILEVGCGIALTSLLLNDRQANITATDRHPAADFFLQRNTELNHGQPIKFERTDWADKTDQLGRFDLIIGSDVLYEDEHILLLAEFLEAHANPRCEIIIVDPGRGRKNKLDIQMQKYGFKSSFFKPANTDYLAEVFNGFILCFSRGQQ